MIGLDTNILLRAILQDDQEQSRRARSRLEKGTVEGEEYLIPDIVLCEIVWSLKRGFKKSKPEIILALSTIEQTLNFRFESELRFHNALNAYREGKGDFADYLILERCHELGCERLLTFDQTVLSEKGFSSV